MSSLSFDNHLLPPDAADLTEGVSHLSSGARTARPSVHAGDPRHKVAFPEAHAAPDASPWVRSALRRVFDIAFAALALIAFLPVMACAAIIVRFGSEGPVLFRQRRMGRNGREFTLYKFRSMCPKKGNNSFITVSGDVRITPVGALLRRFKLDELPQFWNVLRGDMSLVGPRPVLPWEAELFHESDLQRFDVKPGITGLWQVSGRNKLALREGLELEVEYVRRRTFSLDLQILIRTVPAVLRGAR